MRILRSLEDMERRPTVLYEGQPYGPVTLQSRDGVSSAVGPAGVASVVVPRVVGRTDVQRMAAEGISISFDGAPVLRLHQDRHGLLQPSRVLHLHGPDWVPDGAFFRARGLIGRVVLEGVSGRLIDVPRPVLLNGHRRLVLDERVRAELVTVFALVRGRLFTAVQL